MVFVLLIRPFRRPILSRWYALLLSSHSINQLRKCNSHQQQQQSFLELEGRVIQNDRQRETERDRDTQRAREQARETSSNWNFPIGNRVTFSPLSQTPKCSRDEEVPLRRYNSICECGYTEVIVHCIWYRPMTGALYHYSPPSPFSPSLSLSLSRPDFLVLGYLTLTCIGSGCTKLFPLRHPAQAAQP